MGLEHLNDFDENEMLEQGRRRKFVQFRLEAARRLAKMFGKAELRDREEFAEKHGANTAAAYFSGVNGEAEGIALAFLDFVRRVDWLCQDSEREQFGDTPSVYVHDLRLALYESLQIRTREFYEESRGQV